MDDNTQEINKRKTQVRTASLPAFNGRSPNGLTSSEPITRRRQDPDTKLNAEIHKLQKDQIQILRQIEKLKKEGAKSDEIRNLEETEKIINNELTKRREMLLKTFKKLKYKTMKSVSPSKSGKIVKSTSLDNTNGASYDDDPQLSPKSEKQAWMKLVKLKKGKGFLDGEEPDIPDEHEENKSSPAKRYQTVDIGFLNIYNDPNKSRALPFEIRDDEASQLSSKLLAMMREEKGGKVLIKDFGVKSDINEKGLQRANKEKVEMKDGSSASGKKKLYQMEDESICSYPLEGDVDKALFGVFDGHAGFSAAKAAKTFFPQEFYTQWKLEKNEELSDAKHVLERTFLKVDNNLTVFEYEGCTATVVYIWSAGGHRYLQAANVGDSTAYLCRGEDVIPISVDHKVTNPMEQQRLKQTGIEVNEGQTRLNGLSIARSLGDSFLKKEKTGVTGHPFVSPPFRISSEDTAVVIASDGLWDVISGKRAAEIIKDETTSTSASSKLLNTVLASPKCQDNVTVIVVRL